MELLTEEITSRGFKYFQKMRTENTALYEQYLILEDGSIEFVAYEVFHIRKQKESFNQALKINYTDKELFPSNERFGLDAYCCKDLKRAQIRFAELEERFANSSHEEIVADEVEEEFTAE